MDRAINPVVTTGSNGIMNIGQLARVADTNAETIRYYERIGLLPSPPRTAGNYRDYSDAHVSCLAFTRRARALGFSIEQVRHCSISPTKKSNPVKPWTVLLANISRR